MGFLLRSAVFVSKSNRMVDRKRKTGSNATEAIAKINRRIGKQETPVLVARRLSRTSAFFYGEADVTPAAPFVMRCALRITAAGLFIVSVSLGHKFGKRSVHLHVVRHQ